MRGFVGTRDFACSSADRKGECSGTWDWLGEVLHGPAQFKYVRYAFAYHATENGKGTWSDTFVGAKSHTSGDIRAA